MESGKPAETRLRVVERAARRTLVGLEPLTGRTNQLRIHCAHVGHAIVGDVLYAGEPHARLCLHAARLAFRHPATNEWVEFASEDAARATISARLRRQLAGISGENSCKFFGGNFFNLTVDSGRGKIYILPTSGMR